MNIINYSEMKKVGTFEFLPPSIILHEDEASELDYFTNIKRTGVIVFDGEKDIFIMPLYIQYVEGGYWDDGALKTAFGIEIPSYIVKKKHYNIE